MRKLEVSEKAQQKNLIYQMYPATYSGFAEMTEVVEKYVRYLLPNYIWLSPVFKSPWVDGGYDVSDYCQIDTRFGTMADFDAFVATCRKYRIKVMLDLPMNHTSTEHEWFLHSSGAAVNSDDKYYDYYLWMEWPNNWQSLFGGEACEFDVYRGEYYLHLFDKTQADLNWDNSQVVHEFQEIIRFWTEEHGVAGFRIDMCNVLSKSSLKNSWEPILRGGTKYFQKEQNLAVLRHLFYGKNIFTMGEGAGGELLQTGHLHQLTNGVLDTVYNVAQMDVFDTIISNKNSTPHRWYRRWLKYFLKWASEPTHAVMLENHDSPRAPSRFQADPKALAILLFGTPSNTVCIYQGQEIGTVNPDLPSRVWDFNDVESRNRFERLYAVQKKSFREAQDITRYFSRDNARQPVDWREWQKQLYRKNSTLNVYRKMIDIWRTQQDLRNPNGSKRVEHVRFQNHGRTVSYWVGNLEVQIDLTGEGYSFVSNGDKLLIALNNRL